MCFSKCAALKRSAAHTKRHVMWFWEHSFTIVFKDMLVMHKTTYRCSSEISHLNVLAHQLRLCSTAINGLQQRIIAGSVYRTTEVSVKFKKKNQWCIGEQTVIWPATDYLIAQQQHSCPLSICKTNICPLNQVKRWPCCVLDSLSTGHLITTPVERLSSRQSFQEKYENPYNP